MVLKIDHSLLHEANLCRGKNPHVLANKIAAYRAAYQFYLDWPTDDTEKIVNEAATDLRKYIRTNKTKCL